MRRMSFRPGGIGGPGDDGQGGATTSRTTPSGMTVQAPFRVGAAPGAAGANARGPLYWAPYFRNFTPVSQWRIVFVALAVAYVSGYHVTIGRLRVRI